MCPNFISFYNQVIFHCMNIPPLLIPPFIGRWVVPTFWLLWITLLWTRSCVSLCFHFSWLYTRSGTLGPVVTLFSIVVVFGMLTLYTPCIAQSEVHWHQQCMRVWFVHLLANTCYWVCFYYSLLGGYEVFLYYFSFSWWIWMCVCVLKFYLLNLSHKLFGSDETNVLTEWNLGLK